MLPDYLRHRLDVVFVGTSVGYKSAELGHYYSDRRNKFWLLLCESGLTGGRLLRPEEDSTVVEFGIGLTDLVRTRPSSSDRKLESADYDVLGFRAKIRRFRPRVVAFNGKPAAEQFFPGSLHFGLTRFGIEQAKVYILPSSSGRSRIALPNKAVFWTSFGDWLREQFIGRNWAMTRKRKRS